MFKFKFSLITVIALCLLSSPLFAMQDDDKDESMAAAASRPLSPPPPGRSIVTFFHEMSLTDRDEFDFLSNNYSSLVSKANQPFTQCSEETLHYEKLEKLVGQTGKSPEAVLMDGGKEALNKKTLHWFGEEQEKFVLDQVLPMVTQLQSTHPTHGYFDLFFRRASVNHSLLEDALLAAEYIFQVMQDAGGGTALFLGRTPCIVQVAYEEVLKTKKDETQVSVHLNFSGHPDALTKRESSFFKSKVNIARDIVTPEKLSHYFLYLDTKDVLKAKKLFIVDMLGTGSGLNSFLRVLRAYYHIRETRMPDLTFLNLTADMNWSIDRSEFYTFNHTNGISNQGTLVLPEDKKRNMKPFQVPAYGVPIFDKLLTDVLDQDMFQEFLVRGIQYPAQK